MTQNNSLDGGCYGQKWKYLENYTFATALNNIGYNTFYSGKYLNQVSIATYLILSLAIRYREYDPFDQHLVVKGYYF